MAIVTKTLGEMTSRLPIGVVEGDNLSRSFELRPWTWATERRIAAARSRMTEDPNFSLAKLVSLLVASVARRVGPRDFDGNASPDDLVAVGKMFMADVMHVYLCIRLEEIGHRLDVPYKCPVCDYAGQFAGDIRSVEVQCAERPSDLRRAFKLDHPFSIRADQRVGELTLCPPPWVALESVLAGGSTMETLSMDLVLHSVLKSDATDGPLAEADFGLMRKKDIVRLQGASELQALGPTLRISGTCPGKMPSGKDCGMTFDRPLPWSYDRFFAPPSPSPPLSQ